MPSTKGCQTRSCAAWLAQESICASPSIPGTPDAPPGTLNPIRCCEPTAHDTEELAMGTTWLRALAAAAGLGLMISASVAQGQKQLPDAPAFTQIKLTEKQVQAFLSAQRQIAPLADKLETAGEKGDPALQKRIE